MLGFAYVKLAQQPGYQEADLDKTQFGAALEAAGVGQPGYTPGSLPANTGNMSGAQLAPAAITDLFGPEAGALSQPLIQLLGKFLPEGARNALMQQRRIAAGAGTTAEAQRMSETLSKVNSRLMARQAAVLAGSLASIANSKDLPAVARPFVQWAATKAGDPSLTGTVGSIVAALRGADIPVLSPLLNQALHDTPMSYMPIVQSTMIENNGVLDEGLVQQRIAEFEENQNRGLYTDREGHPMDANVAISGFGLAARTFGDSATPLQRVELARLADSVMKHKLASSPAVAYAIVQQLGAQGALQDPAAFDAKIAQLGARLQRLSPDGANSTNVVLGALEMAAKNGVPLEHMIERVVAQGENRRVWEQSGKTPQQMSQLQNLEQATEFTRTKGFAEADSMKGLAAWVAQTQRGRQAFSDFIAEPTAEKSAQMFTESRRARTWADRGAMDPSILRADLGPEQMSVLQMGEQAAFARETGGGGKNNPLAKIMQNPEQYRTMLEDPLSMSDQDQKQFAALPYYVKKHLSNQGVRGVASDYLTGQEARSQPLPQSQLGEYKPLTPEQLAPKPAALPPPVPVKPLVDDRPRTP